MRGRSRAAGYSVRGLTRARTSPPARRSAHRVGVRRSPRSSSSTAPCAQGIRGVVHSAGWVSLGSDPRRERGDQRRSSGHRPYSPAAGERVERLVFTSTLWTIARGTLEAPADEDTAWNLECIRSPYCDTTRGRGDGKSARTRGVSHDDDQPGSCGRPRDTADLDARAARDVQDAPVALIPDGGIPIVDARVLALAHLRALERAEPGRRYVVAGPYLSYSAMAALVARIAGRPNRVLPIADSLEGPLTRSPLSDRGMRGRFPDALEGRRRRRLPPPPRQRFLADAAFGLVHPDPLESIFDAWKTTTARAEPGSNCVARGSTRSCYPQNPRKRHRGLHLDLNQVMHRVL